MTRRYSLRLDLLDEQLLDIDELPFGRIDDLEVTLHEAGRAPTIETLTTGLQSFGERIGGLTGAVFARAAQRLRPPDGTTGPASIECSDIMEVEERVRVRWRLEERRDIAGLEHWLAQHVVEAIPGSGGREGD